MVVLQKHYEFVDRPTSEVPKEWKIMHITAYSIATISGYIAYHVFSSILEQFGDNCILFPNIQFISNSTNGSVIDESKTVWGSDGLCEFCSHVPLMSMILGTIFITFFCMCPRGGSRQSQSGIKRPWHIVVPSIFLTGIFAVVIFATSLETQTGIAAFCAEFEKVLNTTCCNREIQRFVLDKSTFELNTKASIDALYVLLLVCVLSWFTAFIILLFRCCCAVADFQLIEITISTIDHDDRDLEETNVLLKQNPTASPVSHL